MYCFSLDEYGHFEIQDNTPKLIAGVIYNDADIKNELSTEKKRIRAFYKTVIKEVSKETGLELKYPENLHIDKSGDKKHIEAVAKVKKAVARYFPEFVREGTFKGEELKNDNGNSFESRKGKYLIYCILKSEAGKTGRVSEKTKALLKDDDVAANLYFHMADDVLGRVVFNNPFVEACSKFKLDIATRISDTYTKKYDQEKVDEYKNYLSVTKRKNGAQVTKEIKDKDGDTTVIEKGQYYEIGNIDIYRTLLSKYIIENNPNNIQIEEIMVESMNYSDKSKKCKYEMMYMADTICSFLGFGLKGDSSAEWIKEITRRASKLVQHNQQVIFGYDDIDIEYANAYKAFLNNDYYEAFKIAYDARNAQGIFKDFYNEKWFPLIKKLIKRTKNYKAWRDAVRKLYETQMTNEYEQSRGVYILKTLVECVNEWKDIFESIDDKQYLAQLYMCGLAAYCHMGDWKKAEKYNEQMEKYSAFISSDIYFRSKRIMCGCYTDAFMHTKALKIAKKLVHDEEIMAKAKLTIFPNVTDTCLGFGKACSTCAQSFASLRDSQAEGMFEAALENIKEDTADYYITLSYMLHYFIDSENEDKYRKYAYKYFGNNMDLESQFDYMIKTGLQDNPKIFLKYALFVYIKALYVFDVPRITSALWKKVSNPEEYINKKYKEYIKSNKKWILDDHPTELIYKYICLIAIKREDKFTIFESYDKMNKSVKTKNGLIYYINQFSKIVIEDAKKNNKERNKLVVNLINELKDYNSTVFGKTSVDSDYMFLYDELKKRFTYMYC